MARTIRDLNECSDVEEILVADYQERKAKGNDIRKDFLTVTESRQERLAS